jgi:acetyltransferase-like isoleucine patch superfamily enzyme
MHIYKRVINNILERFKGSSYKLDPKVPKLYLTNYILKRALMTVKGSCCRVKRKGVLFIGYNVRIKSKGSIQVGKTVTIDDGCYIDGLSTNGIILGNNVSIGKRTVIECSGSLKILGKGLIVGNNVGLGRDCFYGCAGGVEIGEDTIIGNFVSFHAENHNYEDRSISIKDQGVNQKGIKVGKDCWIGAKATILDGVTIGDGCIITAGAVMTAGHYEEFNIYGGVPARLLKKRP